MGCRCWHFKNPPDESDVHLRLRAVDETHGYSPSMSIHRIGEVRFRFSRSRVEPDNVLLVLLDEQGSGPQPVRGCKELMRGHLNKGQGYPATDFFSSPLCPLTHNGIPTLGPFGLKHTCGPSCAPLQYREANGRHQVSGTASRRRAASRLPAPTLLITRGYTRSEGFLQLRGLRGPPIRSPR